MYSGNSFLRAREPRTAYVQLIGQFCYAGHFAPLMRLLLPLITQAASPMVASSIVNPLQFRPQLWGHMELSDEHLQEDYMRSLGGATCCFLFSLLHSEWGACYLSLSNFRVQYSDPRVIFSRWEFRVLLIFRRGVCTLYFFPKLFYDALAANG